MKADEERLLLLVLGKGPLSVREAINATHMAYKRCLYILSKWAAKGWYEYGVSLDLGWLTAKGRELAEELRDASATW